MKRFGPPHNCTTTSALSYNNVIEDGNFEIEQYKIESKSIFSGICVYLLPYVMTVLVDNQLLLKAF